jgi:nitrogen regulatory protein PII
MKKWLVLGVFVLISSMLFAQRNGQDVVYLKSGNTVRGIIIEQVPTQSIKIEAGDGSVWVYRMDEIERMSVSTSVNYQDVLYLKSGGIIRGTIIEQVTEKSPVKIETADGSVWIYPVDEIEKITKEKVKSIEPLPSGGGTGLRRGSKMIFESGYMLGDYGLDRTKFNFIVGGQVSPYFSLGFGTGLRGCEGDIAVVPVFLDLRVNFINRKVSPYWVLDLGYSFDPNHGKSGVMGASGVGFSIKIASRAALHAGFEYEYQGVEIYKYGFSRSRTSEAVGFSVGISF